MSKPVVLTMNEFDVNKLKYSAMKTNDKGSRSVFVTYDNPTEKRNHKLYLQFPKMPVPSGLLKNEYQENDKPRYNAFLSFANMESNSKIRLAHEKMCELDEKLINDGVKNHFSWLRQQEVPDRKVVEALYNRRVRVSRDKDTLKKLDYPDSISISIPTDKDGNIRVETFDENQEPVDLVEALQKGCKAIVVVECNGIWFPLGYICTNSYC